MGDIQTERLRLRPFTLDDVDAYLSYRTDPGVLAWLTTATPPTRQEAVARIAALTVLGGPTVGQWFHYAVEHDGTVVGDAGASIREGGGIAEIGYTLHPAHRGRGFATEAAAALTDHLIEHHGIHRIEARLAPANVASMRVIEAIGMSFEMVARLAFSRDGVWEDNLRYALTADERRAWLDRPRVVPEHVELVEIAPDEAYLWGRLRTHYSQEEFVSTMPVTWRDALFPEEFEEVTAVPWMRGVSVDGERVAFVMTSATHGQQEGFYLWRMLVDRMHQRRGIGRLALGLLFDHLRDEGVERLFTSCGQGIGTPQPFYELLGFRPTGRVIDDEVELLLDL